VHARPDPTTSLAVDGIGDRHRSRNAVMTGRRKEDSRNHVLIHLRTSTERGTIDRPLGTGSCARVLLVESPLTTIQTKFEMPKPTELLAAFIPIDLGPEGSYPAGIQKGVLGRDNGSLVPPPDIGRHSHVLNSAKLSQSLIHFSGPSKIVSEL